MERVKQLQEALVVARQERAVAHAKFREASAYAQRLANELLTAELAARQFALRVTDQKREVR